jgi:capsular exopolysaccharide synthesis family protein
MGGKSLTAVNLAVAMAQAGQRVILVDADLRRPRLHRVFELQNKFGLTTAFFDDISGIEGLLQESSIENLRVLTSGQIPPNPAELLGSARMQDVLTRLQALSDMVIFDSPPAIGLADSAILSAQLDGVLLVLAFQRTRRGAAQQALNGLQQVGARVLGVVLNRVPLHSNGYYYNYTSGYSYGVQGDAKEMSSSNIIGRRRRKS